MPRKLGNHQLVEHLQKLGYTMLLLWDWHSQLAFLDSHGPVGPRYRMFSLGQKRRKLMGRWVVPAIFLVIQNIGLYHMYVGVL